MRGYMVELGFNCRGGSSLSVLFLDRERPLIEGSARKSPAVCAKGSGQQTTIDENSEGDPSAGPSQNRAI